MKKLLILSIIGCNVFACKPSKDQLMKEFINSCIDEAGRAAKDDETKKLITDYCNCAGQKMIDQFSVEELQRLIKNPNDADIVRKLEPIINSCSELLKK